MPTLAVNKIKRALYGKLAGDTTLNALLGTPAPRHNKAIYYELAPEGAAFPYVIFQKQSGTPVYAMVNGGSAYDEDLWLFKAIVKPEGGGSTADDAEAIAERIDTLLTDASLTISGASLMYLRRESDIAYVELSDGVRYEHVGALYRIVFQ